jgi:hypothetical protein
MRYPPRSIPLADALLPWVEDDDMPDPPTGPPRTAEAMIVALPSHLSVANRREFEDAIYRHVHEYGYRHFVVDCARGVDVSPAGWGVLLKLTRWLACCDGSLTLRDLPSHLQYNMRAVIRGGHLSVQPPEVRS